MANVFNTYDKLQIVKKTMIKNGWLFFRYACPKGRFPELGKRISNSS
jgi:hypothetical protein